MSIRLHYESGKSATYSDITDRLRLYTLDLTQDAEEGSVALSSVTIDDPNGDYDIVGWRRMYFVEDTATGSNTVMYNGYTADRAIERGPYVTGAGRVWKVSLADSNAVAQWRVMTQASANRGAETDVARVQWLMTTNEMERITQTIYLSTANPVAMDAVDYRGQRGSDVLDDCAQASGKNYFVHTTETAGVGDVGLSLWYGDAGLTTYSSAVRLSNVVADVNADTSGLTFYISDDTSLTRDPARVYSGAYVQYDGGVSYTEDLAISNNFTRRDAVVPAENVKTNAKATARGARYLVDMGTEEDRITTSFRAPAAQVNFVKEGMRVQIKASHLPGYTSYTWARVLKRTIKQDSEESYLVTLELTVQPTICSPAVTQNHSTTGDAGTSGSAFHVIMGAAPTEGNLLVAVISSRAVGVADQTGWTTASTVTVAGSLNGGDSKVIYRTAGAGESADMILNIGVPGRVTVLELSCACSLGSTLSENHGVNLSAAVSTGSISVPANAALIGVVLVSGSGVAGGASEPLFSIDTPFTTIDHGQMGGAQGPVHEVGYRLPGTAGSYHMDVSLTVGSFTNQGEVGTIILAFIC